MSVGCQPITINWTSHFGIKLPMQSQGNKAIGVEYFSDGKIKKTYANKGIVACAGLSVPHP